MAAISRNERYRQVVTILIEEGFGTALGQLGLKAPWLGGLRRGRGQEGKANLSPFAFLPRGSVDLLRERPRIEQRWHVGCQGLWPGGTVAPGTPLRRCGPPPDPPDALKK